MESLNGALSKVEKYSKKLKKVLLSTDLALGFVAADNVLSPISFPPLSSRRWTVMQSIQLIRKIFIAW